MNNFGCDFHGNNPDSACRECVRLLEDLYSYYDSVIFILGSEDPEMNRIEQILKSENIDYEYATHEGHRCNPKNAYSADNRLDKSKKIIFVECAVIGATPHLIVDHHRPGDPGYNTTPDLFWRASSLGQIYSLLALSSAPHEDLVLAAMDHCPAHAICGRCPGVTADEIIQRKIEEISKSTGLDQAYIKAKIDFEKSYIQNHSAPITRIMNKPVVDYRAEFSDPGYSLPYLCKQVAVLSEGRCALIYTADRNSSGTSGKKKICLGGHASPELVQYFIDVWGPEQGLKEIYGVPERGFAGGYLE